MQFRTRKLLQDSKYLFFDDNFLQALKNDLVKSSRCFTRIKAFASILLKTDKLSKDDLHNSLQHFRYAIIRSFEQSMKDGGKWVKW